MFDTEVQIKFECDPAFVFGQSISHIFWNFVFCRKVKSNFSWKSRGLIRCSGLFKRQHLYVSVHLEFSPDDLRGAEALKSKDTATKKQK